MSTRELLKRDCYRFRCGFKVLPVWVQWILSLVFIVANLIWMGSFAPYIMQITIAEFVGWCFSIMQFCFVLVLFVVLIDSSEKVIMGLIMVVLLFGGGVWLYETEYPVGVAAFLISVTLSILMFALFPTLGDRYCDASFGYSIKQQKRELEHEMWE